jgi:hypothetical protein
MANLKIERIVSLSISESEFKLMTKGLVGKLSQDDLEAAEKLNLTLLNMWEKIITEKHKAAVSQTERARAIRNKTSEEE